MRWGGVNDSNAMDAYEDHSGATVPIRYDRPRLWVEVLVGDGNDWGRPWSDPESDPLTDLVMHKEMFRR